MKIPVKSKSQIGVPGIYRISGNTAYLQNTLKLSQTEVFIRKFVRDVRGLKISELIIELNELSDIDSSGVMALVSVEKKLSRLGVHVIIKGGNDSITRKMNLFHPGNIREEERSSAPGFLETLGGSVLVFFRDYLWGFIVLAADIGYWAVADLPKSKTRREGEFLNQSIHIGVNATLIIVMMSFIIGLVMSMHSSVQLRSFGANIYMVDLIVIAMMSQMGPLITAILVAGRSGSAIAAEIATMKVTSELDALTTMGLNPVRFVVVPRLYASMATLPFLIVLSMFAGIVGGAVAAYVYLGITPEIFINRMGSVMNMKYLFYAFIKSQAYAGIIVLTGSFYGFRVIRGAEGVGKATTSAVVVAISLVIVADSILGLIFF
jgi:phospholipid/cholesterol/gamma-HCH transport system permease protein